MSSERNVLDYVLAYLCWFISTVVGFLVMNLAREMILMAMTVKGTEMTTDSDLFYQGMRASAVSQWSWLVIGLCAIALLVGFEHLYRNAVQPHKVWKYFFMVTAIEATALLVIHIIYYGMAATFRAIGWLPFVILATEAAFAILFFWLWALQRRAAANE